MPPSVKTETENIESEDRDVVNPTTTTTSLIPAKQEEQEEESNLRKKSRIEEHDDVIYIRSDDDGDVSDGTVNLLNDDDDDDDDEVMVIEPTSLSEKPSARFANSNSTEEQIDDDIVAVGDSMMKLPHMRQHCTVHKFVNTSRRLAFGNSSLSPNQEAQKANLKHCDLCYCFICDKPVSQCESWGSETYSTMNHCNATDKGDTAYFYKELRRLVKSRLTITPSPHSGRNETSQHPGDGVRSRNLDGVFQRLADEHPLRNDPSPSQKGPWDPTLGDSMNRSGLLKGLLTQCRRCSYFNKFDHLNYTKVLHLGKKSYETGPQDWCHACGRVASVNDFDKNQLKKYNPSLGDVYLGEKIIPFTIKTHDPRKFRDTGKYWMRNAGKPEWIYDEVEMEEDFFRHHIGKNPTLLSILQAVPVRDKVPDYTGDLRKETTFRSINSPCITESDAFLLENKPDLNLLLELYHLHDKSNCVGCETHAEWSKDTRRGTLSVKVHIKRQSFVSQNSSSRNITRISNREAFFSRLLGCWYNVFPFKLSELTNGITIQPLSSSEKKRVLFNSSDFYGDTIGSRTERNDLMDKLENIRAVADYNEAATEICNNLSFYASSHSKDCGVVADSNVTFAEVIKGITSASILDDIVNRDSMSEGYSLGLTAAGPELDITGFHRAFRRDSQFVNYNISISPSLGFTTYLEPEEFGLLHNLNHAAKRVHSRCSTMNGLLQQCENLGHAPADHVDGLNVELFDFQKQAVGWALEREQEGGVERFLWVKLPERSQIVSSVTPKVGDTTNNVVKYKESQLYYSPILDMFQEDEPSDVRGGLIAAQMGLGKTVISLALVLLNPAPQLPKSGTYVAEYNMPLDDTSRTPKWPVAPKLAVDAPSKRGSIFSRGTLVVCNVSLVGQWIDEAKSKLKNPGLVYSYHGSNRKRNAFVLAQNAIVVTTYAVLQSDAFFHSKKSGKSDYCAPCEQVRWWRIICDESHSIRDSNTKNFKAIERLTAVNKWCVTGTPMNTSPKDLKSQLSFIGINHVDQMFSLFANAMRDLFSSNNKKRHRWHDFDYLACKGPFLYFMRNIMIRHSITQTSRSSNVAIMSLPPKREKVIEIEFTEAERREYDRVQEKAKALYLLVKRTGKVSSHYLRLQSALLPLRLACSGGQLDEGQIHRKGETSMESLKQKPLEMNLEEGKECSICLSAIDQPIATMCAPVSHIFCKECINGVFAGADVSACPICRNPINYNEIRDVVPIQGEDEEDGMDSDDTKPQKIKKSILDESDIHFRSKFERLLKELSYIRDNEPGSKSLVFSQFASTLQWMKQELPKHGFQYRTLEGNMTMKKRADALREFQSDPPTTIFLLSIRAGAAGINLTEANRVFLMEPAMNPALEAQAVGRVYRLGQRKPVTVIRMQMKDSFETRLVKVLKRKFDTAKKPDTLKKNDDGDETKKDSNGSTAVTNNIQVSNNDAMCDTNNLANTSTSDKNAEIVTETGTENTVTVVPTDTENVATLGHMARDKADLMTEEFDALFGVVEPEDLPETRNEDNDDNEEDTLGRSGHLGSFRYGCTCGKCSDNGGSDSEDSDEDRDSRECVIS